MLTISLFLAEEQEVSPRTFVIGGIVALIIGLWLSLTVINRRARALQRWGDGPRMSRLSAATAATIAYLVATMFFCARSRLEPRLVDRLFSHLSRHLLHRAKRVARLCS